MKEQQARYLGRKASGTLVQDIVCAIGQKQMAVLQDGKILTCQGNLSAVSVTLLDPCLSLYITKTVKNCTYLVALLVGRYVI